MAKRCANTKCGALHEKNSLFCSRSCANSRHWTEKDKKKKSDSAKNSPKVRRGLIGLSKYRYHAAAARRGIPVEEYRAKRVSGEIPDWISAREGKQVERAAWVRDKETGQPEKRCILCREPYPAAHKRICEKCRVEGIGRYRTECKFSFALNSYPELFNFDLIRKYGWYRPANKQPANPKGVSRDHILSIQEGFKYQVPPCIMRHPANCQLVRHIDNQKKRHKSEISLSQLLGNIEKLEAEQPMENSAEVLAEVAEARRLILGGKTKKTTIRGL